MELSTHQRAALAEFRQRLMACFGSRLAKVLLFGSYVRGEGRMDSDVDVLVLIENMTQEDWRQAIYLAADLLTEQNVLISATPYSTAHFEKLLRMESPFARNVMREGVPL